MTPPVAVVIVTYRSRDTIDATLSALEPAHVQGMATCTVIDNDSGDGSYERVTEWHPWVRAVRSGSNLGYARANNLALAGIASPYVLFLNPDAVIRPEAIRRMVAFLDERPQVGILAPIVLSGRSSVQIVGTFPTPRTVIREALGKRPQAYAIEPDDPPFRAQWLSGAVLMARKDLLDRLGGFDPRFFLYFEEPDLCRRAHGLGAETWALPQAVAEHQSGASTRQEQARMFRGCIAEHYFRSRFYYLRKHFGWAAAAAVELAELVILSVRLLRRTVRGDDPGDDLRTRLRSPVFEQPIPPKM